MVCKEDVLLWFKDLESYNRIDVLHGLLNMCLPFELRFLGSCIEEIGKHTYQELRGPAINSNDIEKLSKEGCFSIHGLLDETVRHRVIVYLSLLSSRNYSVANWLYKNILRTDWLDEYLVKANPKDESVHSEYLLLFVMALYHPAFTFEQKFNINKILSQLMELKESRNRISPSGYGYPPGFGYPSGKNPPEVPVIPVKTSTTMPCADGTFHQQQHCHPHMPPPQSSQEFMPWSRRPGFPCGAPAEVPPPFPPVNVSPLVSEAASPIQSRSNSPHRTIVTLRSTPMGPPPPPLAVDVPTQMPVEPPPPPNNFSFMYQLDHVKMPDEENLNPIPEVKLPESPWLPMPPLKEPKPMNGLRYPVCPAAGPRIYSLDQHVQALNLEGDAAPLHRSNSSSNSSLNQSPPDTPAPAPPPTNPGRGGDQTRVNGMQQQFVPPGPSPGMPLCDTTSPPPPHSYNNTVPYTTYPTYTLPTRTMYPYTQPYRPPFPPFPSYQANDNSFQNNYFPYIIYSSSQLPPPRNPNPFCYNCGATGHSGQECSGQNIEDITQKTTYTIDFAAPPLPDGEK